MVIMNIMKTDVLTVDPEMDVCSAISLLLDHKYGCLPVVSNGKLVGIVTEADFLNLTLGLPAIRTSVDHGTAFDIVGRSKAHPGSMKAAIRMACELAVRSKQRTQRQEKTPFTQVPRTPTV